MTGQRKKMSFQYMAKAIEVKGLTTNEKFVLLIICNYTSKSGESFPKIDTIAEDCAMSKRTVIRCINSLCEKGLLKREHRFKNKMKTSNFYTVFPSKFGSDTQSPRCDTESLSDVTHSHLRSDRESHKPITIDSESINRKKIYKKKKISISEFLEKEGEEGLHQKCRDFALKKNYTKENFQKEYDRYKTHFQANNQKYQNWYLVFTKWVNNQYSMFSQGKHSSSQTQNMTARQKSDLRFQQEYEKRINGGSSIEPDTTSTIDITNYQPQEKKWN